jgi:hypothetical protein
MLFAVVLKVFNLEHSWNPFPWLASGSPGSLTLPTISATHKKVKNLVRRTKIDASYGNSRAFPQAFLKLLETPAPYPDSLDVFTFRRRSKAV